MCYYDHASAYALIAAITLSSSGCASKDEASGDTKGSAAADETHKSDASASDAGASDAARTVQWGLGVYDFPNPDLAVEGVNVCVYPALQACQTTDRQGHVVLGLPANAEVGVMIDGSPRDYFKMLVTFGTTGEDTDDFTVGVSTNDSAKQRAEAGGFTLDPKQGIVIGQALDMEWAGIDGVTTALEPSAGTEPIYYGSGGPDKTLRSTSAVGGGLAVVAEVPPGDYKLRFSGKKCSVGLNGWQGEEQSVARVPVLAGTRTLTAAQCE